MNRSLRNFILGAALFLGQVSAAPTKAFALPIFGSESAQTFEKCEQALAPAALSSSRYGVERLHKLADDWLASPSMELKNLELAASSLIQSAPAAHIENISELKPYIASLISRRLNLKIGAPLSIDLPSTPPRSGAIVFVISTEGKAVAVFKIMNNNLELARDLVSQRLLAKLELNQVRPVPLLGFGNVILAKKARPAILMEYIKKVDIEELVQQTSAEILASESDRVKRKVLSPLEDAVQLASVSLSDLAIAALHGTAPISKDYKEYEIQKVETFLENDNMLRSAAAKNWITEEQRQKAHQKIREIIKRYRQVTDIPGAFVHGDAHLGNIIYNPENRAIRYIDTETLLWSIKKENSKIYGVGDPIADLGRFLAALYTHGKENSYPAEALTKLTEQVIELYLARTRFERQSVRTSLDFYFVRFSTLLLSFNANRDPDNRDHQHIKNLFERLEKI